MKKVYVAVNACQGGAGKSEGIRQKHKIKNCIYSRKGAKVAKKFKELSKKTATIR